MEEKDSIKMTQPGKSMFCNAEDRVEKAIESFCSCCVGCVARIQSNKDSIALMDIECIEGELVT